MIDRGVGANVLKSPALALAHLARVLADLPQFPPLVAGEIVTTGTITDAWPVAPGETWSSDYGALGLDGIDVDVLMSTPFIERHGLWSDEQRRRADEIRRRVEADKLRYVRLAWGDTHGYARAKTLTIPAFLSALSSGHNIGVATTTLDSAGARVFASFTRGGGMGIDQMTGSPNITAVPDPATFRVLPWAPGHGMDPVRRVLQRRHAVPVLDAAAPAQGAAAPRRARARLRGRRRDRVVPAARRRRRS